MPNHVHGIVRRGELLLSKTGRALAPVPSFRKSRVPLMRWLVSEAQIEGVDTGVNVWARDRLVEMDPRNLSMDDTEFLRDVLFGDPFGPGPANRVAATPDRAVAP